MDDLALPWLAACTDIVDAQRRIVPWLRLHQPPGVTMMTACVRLAGPIDTRALEAGVAVGGPFRPVAEDFAGVSFVYENTNMHVKVFASGNVHVAGARSSVEVARMLEDIGLAVLASGASGDADYASGGLAFVRGASYPLLNVLTTTTTTIALGKLHAALIELGWPSLYANSAGKKSPGLRIRLPSCSVLVYASGKINVSASSGEGGDGASACAAVVRGFEAVFEVLDIAARADGIVGEKSALPKRTASARPAMFVDGYTTDVVRLCA